MTDPVLRHTINKLLNEERRRKNFKSDRELAVALGVSTRTLSNWRQARSLGRAAYVLLHLVVQCDEEGLRKR